MTGIHIIYVNVNVVILYVCGGLIYWVKDIIIQFLVDVLLVVQEKFIHNKLLKH